MRTQASYRRSAVLLVGWCMLIGWCSACQRPVHHAGFEGANAGRELRTLCEQPDQRIRVPDVAGLVVLDRAPSKLPPTPHLYIASDYMTMDEAPVLLSDLGDYYKEHSTEFERAGYAAPVHLYVTIEKDVQIARLWRVFDILHAVGVGQVKFIVLAESQPDVSVFPDADHARQLLTSGNGPTDFLSAAVDELARCPDGSRILLEAMETASTNRETCLAVATNLEQVLESCNGKFNSDQFTTSVLLYGLPSRPLLTSWDVNLSEDGELPVTIGAKEWQEVFRAYLALEGRDVWLGTPGHGHRSE